MSIIGSMDNRQGFPVLYDAHHAMHMEDLPFWQNVVSQQKGLVLELGCGTGRVSIVLAQSGFTVYALDIDPFMLRFLKRRLQEFRNLEVRFFQSDMAAFHLKQLFGAILLPCNTLSTLTPTHRQATFQCISSHLDKDGVFAASLPNPTALYALPAGADSELEEYFYHPEDGEPVQVSSAWKRTKGYFSVTWHYDHLLPDGRVDRLSTQVQHRLETLNVYQDELEAVGMAVESLYGDFNFTPFSSESSLLIIVARKSTC